MFVIMLLLRQHAKNGSVVEYFRFRLGEVEGNSQNQEEEEGDEGFDVQLHFVG